jgi:16S rRNA (cytidine1402-2'-O)-methyltransferase
MAEKSEAALYLVPTPIGNLEDITLRAIRILKESDLILAEDTRKSGILLKHYDISTPMKSFHAHNEHKVLDSILEKLEGGSKLSLITDAGTPGISDPGFLLVRECLKVSIEVECLPGATAFVPALVKSGIPCDRFLFEGFLPPKKGRKSRFEDLKDENRTLVFYESPHRLLKTLEQMIQYFGNGRLASVSRELTKLHEETRNGTLEEIYDYFQHHTLKGEIVIIVAGKS